MAASLSLLGGALSEADANKLDEIDLEIAKCDAALQ